MNAFLTDKTSNCDSIGFRIHLLSYLNVSSLIPRGKRHFYPANWFWKNRKSLFIAEPRSDFNRCYEQRMSENHYWILFITVSLWFWSVAKYKRPIFKGFNSLHYWAGLNVLKVNCFWSCVPWTHATCLLRTNGFRCLFRYYYSINANTVESNVFFKPTKLQNCRRSYQY